MVAEEGKNLFVRTVTDYWVGRCVSVDGPHTVTLVDFAWVASTGRLHQFLAAADTYAVDNIEIEAAPDGMCIQCTGTIIQWPHKLLRRTVPA